MTIIYFILILGLIIFVHEFGHFIFAKRSKIYVYEFSLGMGPKIFSFHRKNDPTEYSLRIFPIGGFVRLAGEGDGDDETAPKGTLLQDKSFKDRFLTMFMGAGFNFLLAIFLLFISGLFYGVLDETPVIGVLDKEYPMSQAGFKVGDKIIKINNTKTKSYDHVFYELFLNPKKTSTVTVNRKGKIYVAKVKAIKEINENKEDVYKYGFNFEYKVKKGLGTSLKYAFNKTGNLINIMFKTIKSLFVGQVKIKQMSGPVGIYGVVADSQAQGLESVLYLIAFLSINIGFINLLPFPAFDGGRILFLFIEKFRKKPITPEIENMIHNIGFIMLILLMLVVTFNDIVKVIKT